MCFKCKVTNKHVNNQTSWIFFERELFCREYPQPQVKAPISELIAFFDK